jgi:octaprenyl-diphosphate synthase
LIDKETLLSLLKPEAAKIDAVMAKDLKSVENSQLSKVLEYAIFSGGKRVRPLLTLLASRLSTKVAHSSSPDINEDSLYQLAITFEYLHVASLLHDDVIDHADQRRGKPTANSVWGATPVILAGDYLHSRALFLAGSIGKEKVLATISKATAAMVESEFIQMESAKTHDKSENSYFRVLHGKTAALIAAACQTGALYGNAAPETTNALVVFGTNIGLAFQIVDDLLDYLGDPGKTGKAVGNDFVEGKMTLPLIYAMQNSNNTSKSRIDELLAQTPEDRGGALAETKKLIVESGGFAYARDRAEALIREAADGLKLFPESPEKDILLGLGQYILKRDK